MTVCHPKTCLVIHDFFNGQLNMKNVKALTISIFITFACLSFKCTGQIIPISQVKIAKVLLREDVDKEPINYRLTIPNNYFVQVWNQRDAISRAGTTSLYLWTIYPSFSGLSSENYEEIYDKITPNKSIRFSLEAVKSTTPDWGAIRLNHALNLPPNDRWKIKEINGNRHSDDLVEYEFVNQPGKKAYSWKENGAVTYVNCSGVPMCEVSKTWHGMLTVRYFFHQEQISNLRKIDHGLNELIDSFHPVKK
jgi:hypothetical protein